MENDFEKDFPVCDTISMSNIHFAGDVDKPVKKVTKPVSLKKLNISKLKKDGKKN